MKLLLKMLAPYFAVGVFWCVWPNAWLALLAYHVQIVFWQRRALRQLRWPTFSRGALFALPAVLGGPLLYVLLPLVTRVDLSEWLASYHLSGVSLLVMIPYFGIVHPLLEQLHWRDLRDETVWSHLLFSGYHMIVLSTLLTGPGLVLCFCVLLGASLVWKVLVRTTGGLTAPALSHVLADLGIVVAAWLKVQ
jgi:hypothetical protein